MQKYLLNCTEFSFFRANFDLIIACQNEATAVFRREVVNVCCLPMFDNCIVQWLSETTLKAPSISNGYRPVTSHNELTTGGFIDWHAGHQGDSKEAMEDKEHNGGTS